MQTINRYMVMRFSKVYATLFVAIVLMLSMASCHKDSLTLNSLATFDIELQKMSSTDGIASKSTVSDFEAVVSVAYADDTVGYKCRFVASDSISESYMYDVAHSDVVYASIGKPFRLLVDANIGGLEYHGESEIFVIDGEPLTVPIDIESALSYVNLGLPSGLLWANCNLGASSPEGYGSYFAWGETSDKLNYSWETYSYYNDSLLVKYNGSDSLTSLESIDDAVTAMLGSDWRMPTKAEFDELLEYCTATFATSNGVNGYRFTGSNGNSIFLPMAGGRDGDGLLSCGESGFYWLSSLYSEDTEFAWGFVIDSESAYTTSYYRMYGQTIRPVYVNQ